MNRARPGPASDTREHTVAGDGLRDQKFEPSKDKGHVFKLECHKSLLEYRRLEAITIIVIDLIICGEIVLLQVRPEKLRNCFYWVHK